MDKYEKPTRSIEQEFMYHLLNALLLGLKEQGCIGEMQYRCAEEQLRQQFPQSRTYT